MSGRGNGADQAARARALDPAASFIVQAPAGSGKTGLLTQRYLVLLAQAGAPEEIVAITFTRKAAGEMRRRILDALACARSDRPPQEAHEMRTWELARAALERDRAAGWHLLENPARLRILTIDSLCMALARQMPLLSRCGAVPAIVEDATPLYREAAANTITELESGMGWSEHIAHLALHLDNRLDELQELLSTMLARRDQWLRRIAERGDPRLERANLEGALARLVTDALRNLAESAPRECIPELSELACFAAHNLTGSESPVAALRGLRDLPRPAAADRRQWEGLAELLLTGKDEWRRVVTRDQGFPPPTGATTPEEKALFAGMKQRMVALLDSLREEDVFRESLAALRRLPPHAYTDGEWDILRALIEVLRLAAAQLELVFRGRGQVDFTAMARAAIDALGGADAPTDLALALDYRIRHLLVDEFQDTSLNQYELLRRLTAGWQPGDGRTLFVVGDPMQSIYRFREAEVGLFLDARAHGVGDVALEFLRLTVNFRSQRGIVDWINRHFPSVLAAADHVAAGAVSYAPSVSRHPQLPGAAVTVHPFLGRDDSAEARQIVTIIRGAQAQHPEGTTAVLARGRAQLAEIVLHLQGAGLRFQAVEIESLAHRPVVQDLLALTQALAHIGDRIAWLAVLRAPYCGMSLDDLHRLAGGDEARPVIELLHEARLLERLSEDGRRRVARVLPVLETALAERLRCTARTHVEGAWIALGGPACVDRATDLEDAEVYLQLLEALDSGGEVQDLRELRRQVEKLFALPDMAADGSLQLMTIHKAKGLEFDTVIVPGLGRPARGDNARLLYWAELAREAGASDLLLAPIGARGEDKNRVAACLAHLEKQKGRYEDGRLLYVAATRARRRLHLLGHVDYKVGNQDEIRLKAPPRDTLLARLWPVVESDFSSVLAHRRAAQAPPPDSAPLLRAAARTRLALDWSLPPPPETVRFAGHGEDCATVGQVEFDWAGETARHVGTVVHRLLQHVGRAGIGRIRPADVHRLKGIGRQMLHSLGVPVERVEGAHREVCEALEGTLQDARGRWILSGEHREVQCEWAVSGVRSGAVEHVRIDRTFVDERETRWIIDYKTGAHTGGGIDAFLDREHARYREQLERYAGIMSRMDERPIRLGLYFPLHRGWREWPYSRR